MATIEMRAFMDFLHALVRIVSVAPAPRIVCQAVEGPDAGA